MKYDVFISSKSEDYGHAEKVYDFLIRNDLKVFLASRELDRLGESEYSSAIDDAIDNTTHMVVVATSVDHINSQWVKYEWNTFSNDLKSGYRQGNLITILSHDIELRKLPPSLRHQQSFRFDTYKQHLLSYLREDNSMLEAKLKEALNEIKRLNGIICSKNDEINDLQKRLQESKARIKALAEAAKTERKTVVKSKPLSRQASCSTISTNTSKKNNESKGVFVVISKKSVRAKNDLDYVLAKNSLSLFNATELGNHSWRIKVKNDAAAQKLMDDLERYSIDVFYEHIY